MDIREQELEQRLRTAMDHAAPDAWIAFWPRARRRKES